MIALSVKPIIGKTQNGSDLSYGLKLVNLDPKKIADWQTHQGKMIAPGQFAKGHRKKENLIGDLHIGVLDYDHATPDDLQNVQENPLVENSSFLVCHSSSSTPAAPRFRIEFIFSEPVAPIFYPYIMQQLADEIGLEVDSGSFQPTRAFCGDKHRRDPIMAEPGNVLDVTPYLAEARCRVSEQLAKKAALEALPKITTADREHPYLTAAIQGEIDKCNAAPASAGNDQLFRSACRLFGFAKAGYIPSAEIWAILMETQAAQRRTDREAQATLKSAEDRAEAVYIPEKLFSPSRQSGVSNATEALPNIELFHLPKGIPDQFRSEIMGLNLRFTGINDKTLALVVMELINELIIAGILDPEQPITIDLLGVMAFTIGRNTDKTSIRRGLTLWANLGFATCQKIPNGRGHPILHYHMKPLAEGLAAFIELISQEERKLAFTLDGHILPDEVTEKWIALLEPDFTPEQRQAAADALNAECPAYKLHDRARKKAEKDYLEAVDRLSGFALEKLVNLPSTKLAQNDSWENADYYRMSFYRARAAFRHKRGIVTTTQKAADEAGVTVKTLRMIRQKVGYTTDPFWDEKPFDPQKEVLEQLPSYTAKRGYVQCKLASDGGNEQWITAQNAEQLPKWAACEIDKGHAVKVTWLKGSKERPATAAEIADLEIEQQRIKEERAALRAEEKTLNAFYGSEAETSTDRRESKTSVTGEILEKFLKEFITGLDLEWVIVQLDRYHPDWEFKIDLIRYGAVVTPVHDLFADLPGWESLDSDSNQGILQINTLPTQKSPQTADFRKQAALMFEQRQAAYAAAAAD